MNKKINIEEMKRYLKRSLKNRVRITTSLVMLFLMSNGITRADYIVIDDSKIYSGSPTNFSTKRGKQDAESVGLNARKEGDKNEIAIDKVAKGSVAIGFGAETKNENFQGKYAVAIGHNSTALAENSISIGKDSYTLASGSIAIGKGAIVEKNSNDSIAFGKGTKTVGENSISYGVDLLTKGKNNTNVGQLSQVTGEKNQVVGYANKVKGDQNLVFGSNVTIDDVNNAIVFGNESKPISGAVSFGNDTTTRQLKYIAEGTDDTDAVNFKQLKNYVGAELGKIKLKQGSDGKSAFDIWKELQKKNNPKVSDSELTENNFLNSLKGKDGKDGTNGTNTGLSDEDKKEMNNKFTAINKTLVTHTTEIKGLTDRVGALEENVKVIDKKADLAINGISNAIAMANLPQVSSYGKYKHMLTAAYGNYGGANAVAIGFSGTTDSRKLTYKVSGAVNTKGNLAFGLGVGVMLGETNDYKERKDTNLMKKELDEANKKIADYEEKQKKSDEKIKSLEQKQKVSDDRMKELEKKLELLLKNRK